MSISVQPRLCSAVLLYEQLKTKNGNWKYSPISMCTHFAIAPCYNRLQCKYSVTYTWEKNGLYVEVIIGHVHVHDPTLLVLPVMWNIIPKKEKKKNASSKKNRLTLSTIIKLII